MAQCQMVVINQYAGYARPCARDALEKIGDINYCWQHLQSILNNAHVELIYESASSFTLGIRSAIRQVDQRLRDEAEEARKSERRSRSVVYFVERDGFIKIGTTTQLAKRLQALSRGGQMPDGMTVGPVQLLATLPGTRGNESWLHHKFADQRISRTEWFYPSPELTDFIAGLSGAVGRASA